MLEIPIFPGSGPMSFPLRVLINNRGKLITKDQEEYDYIRGIVFLHGSPLEVVLWDGKYTGTNMFNDFYTFDLSHYLREYSRNQVTSELPNIDL